MPIKLHAILTCSRDVHDNAWPPRFTRHACLELIPVDADAHPYQCRCEPRHSPHMTVKEAGEHLLERPDNAIMVCATDGGTGYNAMSRHVSVFRGSADDFYVKVVPDHLWEPGLPTGEFTAAGAVAEAVRFLSDPAGWVDPPCNSYVPPAS